MQNIFFISGIDTDCGKTFVTGNLANILHKRNRKIITHKLIQTGCKGISEDILEHRKLMNCDLFPEDNEYLTCPCVLPFPASPHLSLELCNQEFDKKKTINSLHELSKSYEIVLSEGAGGLMVPLTRNYLVIDFIQENNMPLILVSSSKLGSLNHTLLSLAACIEHKIDLRYVIYNEFPENNPTIAKDSYKFLSEWLHQKHPSTRLIHINEIMNTSENDNINNILQF